MRDIDVFRSLLGLKRPWTIGRVVLDPEGGRIDVAIHHRSNARFRCSVCGAVLPLHDHGRLRKWRHLDHGTCETWLLTRVPRVSCLFHGIRQVSVPWALPGSRFTLDFEKHAIDTLLEADVTGASRLLRLSWDEAWGIMERAVSRGLKAKRRRAIRRLGVDEKAIAKGHRYMTLVNDLDRGTVEFIAFDRKTASLNEFYQSLSAKHLASIRAVAMDMWDPFVSSTRGHVPDAAGKIVFDRFHIMKHMVEAVDAVRKAEHRSLLAEDDETLKGTKYLWLYSEENLSEKQRERFAGLRRMHLQTARAWAIKESLRDLWNYRRKAWARRHWRAWHNWAMRSRLKPVVKVARMIEERLENVLTYCDHRITNAAAEGLNSRIQTIKKTPAASAIEST